jgi:hypothetical protein
MFDRADGGLGCRLLAQAQSLGEHELSRVDAGLLKAQFTQINQFLSEVVVGGDLTQHTSSQQVCAAVTDVANDQGSARVNSGDDQRGAHAPQLRLIPGPGIDR